jgi:undecaprenyl-diphosphatase
MIWREIMRFYPMGGGKLGRSALDLYLFHLVNGPAGHVWLDSLVWQLEQNDLSRELILIAPYVFFWVADKSAESRSKLMAGLSGAFLAVMVARAVAHIAPFEIRPMYDAASGYHALATDYALDMQNWSSFPSDTAAFSVALTLGLFSRQKTASVILTALSVVVFGVSRIYLGLHYPSDALVGWVIGGGSAAVANLPIARRLATIPLRLEQSAPPLFYALAVVALAEIGQMFENVRAILGLLRLIP